MNPSMITSLTYNHKSIYEQQTIEYNKASDNPLSSLMKWRKNVRFRFKSWDKHFFTVRIFLNQGFPSPSFVPCFLCWTVIPYCRLHTTRTRELVQNWFARFDYRSEKQDNKKSEWNSTLFCKKKKNINAYIIL